MCSVFSKAFISLSLSSKKQVNIVVNEFGKIHIDSAKETFGTITKSNNRKKKRNTKIQKPWFDLDCKFERLSDKTLNATSS
jgi:hypothetical protein